MNDQFEYEFIDIEFTNSNDVTTALNDSGSRGYEHIASQVYQINYNGTYSDRRIYIVMERRKVAEAEALRPGEHIGF